jgi:hypothetical protein
LISLNFNAQKCLVLTFGFQYDHLSRELHGFHATFNAGRVLLVLALQLYALCHWGQMEPAAGVAILATEHVSSDGPSLGLPGPRANGAAAPAALLDISELVAGRQPYASDAVVAL